MTDVVGQEDPSTTATEFNMLAFVFELLLSRISTVKLVKVISCTNSGGVSPVGTVVVRPLVNQMTGAGQGVPHDNLYSVPYLRVQGGTNAVILDPEPGDIGACGFCDRDISLVKVTKDYANPGSPSMMDWADGLYFGGFLNGAPSQYVAFSAAGLALVSPTKISLSAPVVDIEATTSVTVNSPANTIEGGGTSIDGKPFLPHAHTGVQSGGSDSGPVA